MKASFNRSKGRISFGNTLIQRSQVSYTESIEFHSDDVIIIKFVKVWDLSEYFERTTSERHTYKTLLLWGKLSWRHLYHFALKTPDKSN